MIRFRVLGPVEAWDDHHRLELGGPRQVALLAFLLVHANRAVDADTVIDAVWGPERQGAGKRLQMGVYRLRRVLEPLEAEDVPRLRTVSSGYLLSVQPGELDAEVFAQAVRDGLRMLEAGEPERAGEVLAEALALWRGPPLAEVAFEDFARSEIRRLDELRVAALESRIEADLQLGRHAELIGELEALLAEQPTRERVAAQLMTALYRSGRQSDALEAYQRIRARLAADLGLEPGPAVKVLQRQILEQAPALQVGSEGRVLPLAAGRSRGRVPSLATPTIGRDWECEISTLMFEASGTRLVTLTGPGGVGKTRLAVVAARALEHGFEHGVRWIELAGLTRSEDVGSTIVRTLEAAPAPGESATDTLLRYLADKQLLLVVDNFEHVLDSARLISELIAGSPRLQVLATSRELLGIAAEHRYDLAPMPVPPRPEDATVAEVEATAGTALFLAAARRRKHAFAVDPATAPLVARVCARVDGLPLAVELAAARIGVLTMSELAARLNDALALVGPGPRDAPERQQTLQATIRWSYRLLRTDEQHAFIRFAVFAGGATLTAAQEVCDASPETLEALQAKSLLRNREEPDGTTRLMMLETVRQFANEAGAARADVEETRRRHAARYLRLVEQSVARLHTADEPQALDALDRDIDNIRSALSWALARDPLLSLKLAGLLGDYWSIRNDADGLAWMDAALTAAGDQSPPGDRGRVHVKRARQLSMRSQWQEAVDAATLAVHLYQEERDDAGVATAYGALSSHRLRLGQHAEARASADAACYHAQAARDDALLGRSLSTLASVLPHAERRPVTDRAVRLLSQAGDYRAIARLYSNAGWIALLRDRPEEAIDFLDTALAAADKLHTPATTKTIPLSNLGLAQLLQGNPKEARAAFIEALKLCTSEAFRWGGAEPRRPRRRTRRGRPA